MEASVATTPSQGPPAEGAQSQASGQGTQQNGATADGKGGSTFNWGLFPSVPENQRELLQPHLSNVLGHVTRIEQQYSPYKGLMEAVTPDQVQNLVTFLNNYGQDPLATWLGLAQSLQEDGHIPQFDIEELQALIQGAQGPEQQGMPGAEDMPPWAQGLMTQVGQMGQFMEQIQQAEEQRAAEAEAAQQERLLAEAQTTIKGQLKESGIPENLVSDNQIVAALIAHRGDMNAVVQSFSGLRDGFLKGFTEQNGSGSRPPTVSGQTPEAPKGGLRSRRGDGFREASIGAQQMLAQAARASEQGN